MLCFLKVLKVCTNDKPWTNIEVKKIDRKRKREYVKNGKSDKWKSLNKHFHEVFSKAKHKYYEDMVEDLKTSDQKNWYAKLKRMSCDDLNDAGEVDIMNMIDISPEVQIERIADNFAFISNQFKPLDATDID